MSFVPSERDVRMARSLVASLGFPNELVLIILELARYWPESTHELATHRVLLDEEWSIHYSAVAVYLVAKVPETDPRWEHQKPKMREVEFTIVSHDQGWTTENTQGSYDTSSWFEVSILRPDVPETIILEDEFDLILMNLEVARASYAKRWGWTMVPRPSLDMEPQRLHCEEMKRVTWTPELLEWQRDSVADRSQWTSQTNEETSPGQTDGYEELDEGKHSWYLQGNQVAKGTSVFEGELVKRYHVIWGCAANPNWKGNAGTGSGHGFIDSLREGDSIVVYSRAKRRGWENHVYGVRITMRYSI